MMSVYIDDTTSFCVDMLDNGVRLKNAIILAIHAAARPFSKSEHIPREEMVALAKLLVEAGLEEPKMILGLFFDFRRMLLSVWGQEINRLGRTILY